MGRFAARPVAHLLVPAALALAAALLLGARTAQARPMGIASSSFGSEGCNQCHGGGTAPLVALSADSVSPTPGQAITLTFAVTSQGASQTAAGFNLRSSQQGTFAPGGPEGAGTRAVDNTDTGWSEATHVVPKPGSGSPPLTTFSVTWTPSAGVNGAVTFTAWGNSVNGADGNQGDRAASTTLTVSFCAQATYFRDGDGDGYGNPTLAMTACAPPDGYVTNNNDCNDAVATIHPGGTEMCNGADDDCDTMSDEGLPVATFFKDNDGDGHGNMASGTAMACSAALAGAGFVADSTDCNDASATVFPGAAEMCNGADDDCDSMTDESLPVSAFYKDNDADGYGSMASGTAMACGAAQAGAGFVADGTDCNDALATVHPGATETCNGADDDCDTMGDEGLPTTTYYRDADGDSFGSLASGTVAACSPARAGAGYVPDNTDCNDGAAAVHPGATEMCNGTDDDCDTTADDGLPSMSYYRDGDGDGHGSSSSGMRTACSAQAAGAGYVDRNTDCDDSDPNVSPSAQEVCDNGKDDNCNAAIDTDAPTSSTFYRDADGDGFGAAASGTVMACAPPPGYVSSSTDCNDSLAAVRPGQFETCNGRDDDCNAMIDDGLGTITCGAPACPTTIAACAGGATQTCTPVCPDAAPPVEPDAGAPSTDARTTPPTDAPAADRASPPAPDGGRTTATDAPATPDGPVAANPDAAAPTDSRPPATADGVRRDATSTNVYRTTGGGCSCRVDGTGGGPAGSPALAVALALLLVLRRRRRR
jgi:MYXO-CTERM domain-containing protein